MNVTLTLSLGAFKQGKLGWVVYHGELVEQCLDHFSYPCLGADMQVLCGVFGEVERGPSFNPSAMLISLLC